MNDENDGEWSDDQFELFQSAVDAEDKLMQAVHSMIAAGYTPTEADEYLAALVEIHRLQGRMQTIEQTKNARDAAGEQLG